MRGACERGINRRGTAGRGAGGNAYRLLYMAVQGWLDGAVLVKVCTGIPGMQYGAAPYRPIHA